MDLDAVVDVAADVAGDATHLEGGVAGGVSVGNRVGAGLTGGNEDLAPETSESWVFGGVYSNSIALANAVAGAKSEGRKRVPEIVARRSGVIPAAS